MLKTKLYWAAIIIYSVIVLWILIQTYVLTPNLTITVDAIGDKGSFCNSNIANKEIQQWLEDVNKHSNYPYSIYPQYNKPFTLYIYFPIKKVNITQITYSNKCLYLNFDETNNNNNSNSNSNSLFQVLLDNITPKYIYVNGELAYQYSKTDFISKQN